LSDESRPFGRTQPRTTGTRGAPTGEPPARPGSGGSEWTRASIRAAIEAWLAEEGQAPRSYDWEPAAARAAGFPLAGAEKWEREHPRWPHAALVKRRYGSWRAALATAGLANPPPHDLDRRARVATAQRLEGAMTATEIAELLGVHSRTVRSYWRAIPCSRCGGPQINHSASSCADCIPYIAYERRTKEDVVRALRRWAVETGAAPRIEDWREPGGKWEREYPWL
jgi:hypothetical protein